MKSIRRNSQLLGVVALTLVCLTFTAAPASAFLDRGGFDPEADSQVAVASRVSMAVSTIQNSLFAFLQKLGVVFAQDGARVLD